MDWTEITISVASKDMEKAENIANMTVPYGIYTEDYSSLEEEVRSIANIDLIDEELLKKDRQTALIHIYISPEDNPTEAIAFLRERYAAEGIQNTISTDSCIEEDWINNWKKYFHPIKVGKKLLIRPTWEENYESEGRAVLNLDPGLAFGTGTHETTRLCLEALEENTPKGGTMLDIGCGSGILSVASLLLGAKSALGVDIDELAVKTARENAALNGVSERMEVVCGNLAEKVSGCFDVIAANIVADAIIELSRDVHRFMTDKSVYIMSGIIDTRLDDVLDALKDKYKVISTKCEKGWYCVTAKKL